MPGRTTNRPTFAVSVRAVMMLLVAAIAGACASEAPAEPNDRFDALALGVPGALAFQPIAPCPNPSAYVTTSVVRWGFGRPVYTPSCVTLATGGTVVFQGDLSQHPLKPRDNGTHPSPIVHTSFGGSVEFEFTNPGFYTFQCAKHPKEKGVVWAGP
jgi:plastocyanin